jgi:sigma-E factor negative regulatory protein RseA
MVMKDQISALMDDELDVGSSPHLFKALDSDDKLRECWSTYHLIGDSMRGAMHLSPDFHQRLMQQIEAEPTVLAPRRKTVMSPSFIMSAAASVAAVMFVGWMVLQQQVQSPAQEMNASTLAQNNVSPESVNAYLLAHHELSPESSMQTAYYARPVAYTENGN